MGERDAFKAVFSFQQILDGLSAAEVPNLDKAKLNVWEFVREIVELVKMEEGGREEDDETTNVTGTA